MHHHDLRHEFPELETKIHELKISNHHFKKLFDDYHNINDEIHRIESGATIAIDEYLTELRKKRLHLKDELYKLLTTD